MRAFVSCLLCSLLVSLSLTFPARGVDIFVPADAPDLTTVRAKIKAGDFKGALAELRPMAEMHDHADVYNLMGFSLRKTGDLNQAFVFYRKALLLDPNHKGALEYLGELYVEIGQIERAAENLALLKKLCPDGCEELADLEKTVAAAKTN